MRMRGWVAVGAVAFGLVAAPAGAQLIWTFEDGTTQGWASSNPDSPVTLTVTGGVLNYDMEDPAGGATFQPHMRPGAVTLDADTYSQFAMQMTLTGVSGDGLDGLVLLFLTDGGAAVAAQPLTNVYPNDPLWGEGEVTVRADLTTAGDLAGPGTGYQGTLTGLQVQIPWAAPQNVAQPVTVEIDWIAITDDPDFVPDQVLPTIELNGDPVIEVLEGGTFSDPGATASDNVDGDLTGSIVVGGDTVDTGTPGTYTVTYSVTDSSNNTASTSRTVEVLADSDADGLADSWEQTNFGDLSQGADDDPDGDGRTNLQEFEEGTDPLVAQVTMPAAGVAAVLALAAGMLALALWRVRHA